MPACVIAHKRRADSAVLGHGHNFLEHIEIPGGLGCVDAHVREFVAFHHIQVAVGEKGADQLVHGVDVEQVVPVIGQFVQIRFPEFFIVVPGIGVIESVHVEKGIHGADFHGGRVYTGGNLRGKGRRVAGGFHGIRDIIGRVHGAHGIGSRGVNVWRF